MSHPTITLVFAMAYRDLKTTGEELAAGFLEWQGMRIIGRNWRIRMGELDLVAMDGAALVFVEVKTRESEDFADPALSVGYRKQTQLRRLAEAYLAFEHPIFEDCRFDVISIVAGGPQPKITHIPNAF